MKTRNLRNVWALSARWRRSLAKYGTITCKLSEEPDNP